jgi:hypothetical protein
VFCKIIEINTAYFSKQFYCLAYLTDTDCVLCEVRTGFLYVTRMSRSLLVFIGLLHGDGFEDVGMDHACNDSIFTTHVSEKAQ